MVTVGRRRKFTVASPAVGPGGQWRHEIWGLENSGVTSYEAFETVASPWERYSASPAVNLGDSGVTRYWA